MIINPILKGFNPDPCICKKGDDFYMAVSSFEWMPAIPIYHSKDMKNWELLSHVIKDDGVIDLKKLPSAKGIWAPCLTYCEEEDLFYVVYGVMNSMNARYFDVDNFLITAKNIEGPWSEPVYLHSAGFDASILHDDDGRKYIVSLEWETREGYEKPGVICICEYDKEKKAVIDYPKRIWKGGTDRGCIEAPHLYKKDGMYYIMCAEGGTGYNHCVTMGRASHPYGEYVGDPQNPIVTSAPNNSYERHDPDHLKPKYYNPQSILQKSGHGSYVETNTGEVYLVHLTSRPFTPELRCTLGRETAIQKMEWTADGWLRMKDGSNIAKLETEESNLAEYPFEKQPDKDDFNGEIPLHYYAPRASIESFATTKEKAGYLTIRGQESRASLNSVSIVARKLTSVYAEITTKMQFSPEIYQHSAGLIMFYDNMNYVNLRKYHSNTLGGSAISIIQLENGEKTEYLDTRIAVNKDDEIYMKVNVEGREFYFSYSLDGENYIKIGKTFDTTKLSDEYCEYGEFTGCFVGMTASDKMFHKHKAHFDFFEYIADETKGVE